MERRERLKVRAHVVFLEFFQQRNYGLVVGRFRRESDLLGSNLLAESAEIIAMCDVEEVDVLL